MTKLNAAGATNTREQIVQAIQTFYDNGVLGYYPINQNCISDIKDDETKLYKRSMYVGDYCFATRLGMVYQNMKNRCLIGGSHQRNSPNYIGTTVCDEWANSFDSFAEWASKEIGFYQLDEHGQPYELDSDLLSNGNKRYSPETCTMLPKAINMALTNRGSKGYQKASSGKFQVRICKYGKVVCMGTFDTEKEASAVYKKARRAYIRELAKRYKSQISIEAYEALMRYKQA